MTRQATAVEALVKRMAQTGLRLSPAKGDLSGARVPGWAIKRDGHIVFWAADRTVEEARASGLVDGDGALTEAGRLAADSLVEINGRVRKLERTDG